MLLHFSVGGSLHYKREWFNIYFRGKEYLSFWDIFFPKILREEKESWKVECIVMGSRHCWEAGMLPGWVGALWAVWGLEKQPWCLWFLKKNHFIIPLLSSKVLCWFARWVFRYYHDCIPVKFLKIHIVKEQALWRKVTKRGWQEEKGNVILALSTSIERSGQTSTICWMHRVGLCSEEGSCSWGILTAYSEGTGNKSPG